MTKVIFQETQRFRQIWIWVLLLGITGVSLGSLFFFERAVPLNIGNLAFPVGMLILLISLFLGLTLSTRITENSLSFRYFPFTKWKVFRFEEIEALELVEYNGLWEYGGWGIKWNGDTWSYTTSGKWGILVKTFDKKFLLGTQQPEQVRRVIDEFKARKSAQNPEN